MRYSARKSVIARATAAWLTILAFHGFAAARPKARTVTPAMEKSLAIYLRTMVQNRSTRYVAAFSDLNGDGDPEAIVYLIGSDYCGSGGCNTLILTPARHSWKVVSVITITNPPILAFTTESHGWRNLGVRVRGGGIQAGYEAELRFNGKRYPGNPSVPPARRLKKMPAGAVLISSKKNAMPLYGD